MVVKTVPRPRFALDTNVLIDLGEENRIAQRFLASFRGKGMVVPPTVVQELAGIANANVRASKFAFNALVNMRRWEIQPYDLIAVGHGLTEINTRKLMASGLLPDEEINDGQILIETALGEIPNLITSDNHLLGINPDRLLEKLAEFDLSAVRIYHPKSYVR